ncbi:hypothetical protein M0R72_10495 [Candidatus Pacearchaeota archaeon]|jgi:hypothetical protein|nr:hypothetical protein [Candidatus Pacearchaeota archaeon]
MTSPINQETFNKIKEAVGRGESFRAIARELDIAHTVVSSIYKGCHPLCRTLDPNRIRFPYEKAAYEWCAICRAKVKKPCLACQIRNRQTARLAESRRLGLVSKEPVELEEPKIVKE